MAQRPALYVLSPALEQAQAIAGLLRSSRPECEIVGAVMDGENWPLNRGAFDRIVRFDEVSLSGAEWIPTGSQSTSFMLDRGPVTLGAVTMSAEALRFYDKPWSLEAASAAGIPVPLTWGDAKDVDDFPVFFKSRAEGDGCRGLARSAAELPSATKGLIFQEFISTPGTYGVAFLAKDGDLLAFHAHYEVESYPELGGSAVIIEQMDDHRLVDYTRRIVSGTVFCGWGLVEFKLCPKRNDYVFMELNAKFWATSEFAFRNQPKFTGLLFGVAPVSVPVRRAIYMHRAFSRGLRFLVGALRKYAPGADLRFIPGQWEIGLMQLLTPRWLRLLVKRGLGR